MQADYRHIKWALLFQNAKMYTIATWVFKHEVNLETPLPIFAFTDPFLFFFLSLSLSFHFFLNHETLPNLIKKKHPRKGEKKKQGARTKVQPSKEPKRGGPTRRQGNSLSIET
jgi:predicted PurR-regulated permease PerM